MIPSSLCDFYCQIASYPFQTNHHPNPIKPANPVRVSYPAYTGVKLLTGNLEDESSQTEDTSEASAREGSDLAGTGGGDGGGLGGGGADGADRGGLGGGRRNSGSGLLGNRGGVGVATNLVSYIVSCLFQ